ncbi:MAG: hypothetical protein K2M73_02160 [Lachnospiraceae bacterium]|nr:hypothetical protein [Lachnospiraceae bacterium]
MKEILDLLPILFISASINIGVGLYYNVGTRNLSFDSKKLIYGIIKAVIVAFSFLGLAYCFEKTDLSSIGVTPDFIINSAIILYVGKSLTSLCKILGIEINTKQ